VSSTLPAASNAASSRTKLATWLPPSPRLGWGLRLVGLSLLLAALTQLVLRAPDFSHDKRFLALLLEHSLELWVLALAWLVALLARQRLDSEGSARILNDRLGYDLGVAALAYALLTPFTNAYFTHVTHPGLAAAVVWVLWPEAEAAVRWVQVRLLWVAGKELRWSPFVAAVVCATLIFVQSYRRYWWFGAGGKDLGLFHQTIWLLSRFETPFNTVMGMHAFADHLEFGDLLVAPVMWVWPDAGALLLFQALVVGAGAIPVFLLTRRKLDSQLAAWAMVGVYLFGIDLQQAVMFDYNPTTVGAAIIPWVVWAFERERPVAFGFLLAALALTKENLVLYGLALCLSLALGTTRRRLPLAAAAALAVFFVVEMKVIFPLFAQAGFRHLRFEAMGGSAAEIVATALESPYQALALLFTPGNKVNGMVAPFSTVAFVCFLAPRWVLAFLPILAERFWSSHTNRWWGFHYGAGVGVLATLAAVDGLARLKSFAARREPRLFGMAVAVVFVSALFVSGLGRFGPGPLWLWRQPYFTTPGDRTDAAAILATVPALGPVAAQNHLLPFLSGRREIFEITRPITAELVVLDLAQSAWPFEPQYARELARELLGGGYGVVACEGQALILQRGASSIPCPALP
jgi:uncharacterized membrane protein